MRIKAVWLRIIIIGVFFCVGIFAGIFSFNVAANPEYLNPSEMPVPGYPYPTNEYGHTYGSAAEAPTLNKEPDLIAAYGDCGNIGYVYATDIDDPAPKTPEEAIARQEETIARLTRGEDVSRQVPLYAVDGKTIIGTFTMGINFSGVIMYQEED